MSECRITTLDNPYNPFTDFDNWHQFDEEHGYCTCGLIVRLGIFDDDMPPGILHDEFERVVDEIYEYNILGIYKKVTEEDYKDGKWKPVDLTKVINELASDNAADTAPSTTSS